MTIGDVRRRFEIEGSDEVTAIDGQGSRAYVGLPAAQARLLQDLWQEGKVGLELAADIKAPSVTGVYGIFQRGERLVYPPPGEVDDGQQERSLR